MLNSLVALWISYEHLTASIALENSTRNASPIVFTSLPLCLARTGLISFLCSLTRASESCSFLWPRAVYPTISVYIIAASLRRLWDTPCYGCLPQSPAINPLREDASSLAWTLPAGVRSFSMIRVLTQRQIVDRVASG